MTVSALGTFAPPRVRTRGQWLARSLVGAVGGRHSTELGIDVHADDAQIERWFLAVTLFGNRILVKIATQTFAVLTDAGLTRIDQVRHVPRQDQGDADLSYLTSLADASRPDIRDIETVLVRPHLAHYRRYRKCAGGVSCQALARARDRGSDHGPGARHIAVARFDPLPVTFAPVRRV